MAQEIAKILEKIGLNKFAAVVTDAGSNLRVARRLIHEAYPHILDLRCVAHAINLIASDFCELDSLKEIIANCGSILNFFKTSHITHGHYQEQLKIMKIKGGEIKSYSKTRWGSFYVTTDSIIRSKPVFDWVNCFIYENLLYYSLFFIIINVIIIIFFFRFLIIILQLYQIIMY